MSCAGCDDCERGKWHLHVTVSPKNRDRVMYSLYRDELSDTLKSRGEKLVVVRNEFHDERPGYEEYIPTCHFEGSEMEAVRALFDMGAWIQANHSGVHVTRLKIEGDPRLLQNQGRAMYYEAHARIDDMQHVENAVRMRLPFSTSAKGRKMVTIRGRSYADVVGRWVKFSGTSGQPLPPVEACVLDTAQHLDNEWIAQ